MGEIAIALLRAIGYPFVRHHSAPGMVAWIVVLLLISSVVHIAVGSFHNKTRQDPGRHERDESRSYAPPYQSFDQRRHASLRQMIAFSRTRPTADVRARP